MISEKSPIIRNIEALGNPKEFKISIHSFKGITKENKNWPGKKLRFAITLGIKSEDMMLEIEGCLARVDKNNELIWTTPQVRAGGFHYNIIFISQALYDRVRDALAGSKYMDYLTPTIVDKSEYPQDIIPDLPTELKA